MQKKIFRTFLDRRMILNLYDTSLTHNIYTFEGGLDILAVSNNCFFAFQVLCVVCWGPVKALWWVIFSLALAMETENGRAYLKV